MHLGPAACIPHRQPPERTWLQGHPPKSRHKTFDQQKSGQKLQASHWDETLLQTALDPHAAVSVTLSTQPATSAQACQRSVGKCKACKGPWRTQKCYQPVPPSIPHLKSIQVKTWTCIIWSLLLNNLLFGILEFRRFSKGLLFFQSHPWYDL